MNNEQQSCIPQQPRTSDPATSPERSAELQSWIDNVIVPILVQEILKTRRKVGGDLGVGSNQS